MINAGSVHLQLCFIFLVRISFSFFSHLWFYLLCIISELKYIFSFSKTSVANSNLVHYFVLYCKSGVVSGLFGEVYFFISASLV